MFALRFDSFDSVVLGIESQMPDIVEKHSSMLDQAAFSDCQIFIAGWSESRRAGEAYVMTVAPPDAAEFWREKHVGSGYSGELFKLEQIHGISGNPPPSPEHFREAGLTFNGTADTVHEFITPLDLLHLLEIQRRLKCPIRDGYPERHWIGGLALLTTVTAESVTQSVMHRWTEDQVGQIVTPRPINWTSWRASRAVAQAGIPEGLSPLQRARMEKKARKGTLRAS
jgi:hypothetical protein